MADQQRFDRGDIRRLNAVSVLNQLRVNGALSRANIASELGLTRATVSNIVSDLMDVSMVYETKYDAGRAGRPGLLLNLNPDCGAMLAVEIDINRINLQLTDFGQTVICDEQVAFDPNAPSDATIEIAETLIAGAISKGAERGLDCLGICVAWAGLVDREQGELAYGPTTGWQHVPVKAKWEARFSVPVYVENAAHAGAIGVHHFGKRPGVRNMIYLSMGVGLAAGVFVDGVLLRGKQGFAGQVGHTAFADNGITCSCGKLGCWVTEIGAAAIFRKLQEAGVDLTTADTLSDDWVDEVIEKAEAGDAVVLEVLSTIAKQVGNGLARLVQTFNPSLVVVGGRTAQLMQVVDSIVKTTTESETLPYMTEPLELAVGSTSDDILNGCIATVFDLVLKNPKIGELAVTA